MDLTLLVKEYIADFFCVLKSFPVFWSMGTSLLCMVRELAGGGFVAVAVDVRDR